MAGNIFQQVMAAGNFFAQLKNAQQTREEYLTQQKQAALQQATQEERQRQELALRQQQMDWAMGAPAREQETAFFEAIGAARAALPEMAAGLQPESVPVERRPEVTAGLKVLTEQALQKQKRDAEIADKQEGLLNAYTSAYGDLYNQAMTTTGPERDRIRTLISAMPPPDTKFDPARLPNLLATIAPYVPGLKPGTNGVYNYDSALGMKTVANVEKTAAQVALLDVKTARESIKQDIDAEFAKPMAQLNLDELEARIDKTLAQTDTIEALRDPTVALAWARIALVKAQEGKTMADTALTRYMMSEYKPGELRASMIRAGATAQQADIAEGRLQEAIRSNKATESIARTRATAPRSSGGARTTAPVAGDPWSVVGGF